ncbi:MAG: hypothetical protein M1822_003162 [Bathelium mastoideum]|nr:MAG: hypothetical protein M1822_003162 [Bathelium mastoideum]
MERALDPEGNEGANVQPITPVKHHGYEAELRNLKRQNDLLRRTALTNKTYWNDEIKKCLAKGKMLGENAVEMAEAAAAAKSNNAPNKRQKTRVGGTASSSLARGESFASLGLTPGGRGAGGSTHGG